MKQHFTEADLLETFYMQPGESMPVMMHLADCSECALRYERLERKLRSLTACSHDEKPESFWARQRMLVMRKIDAQRARASSVSRISRIAAAAAFVLALSGGVMTWREGSEPQKLTVSQTQPTQTVALDNSTNGQLDDPIIPTDPWESDELSEFQSVVAWESWVEPSNGEKAL